MSPLNDLVGDKLLVLFHHRIIVSAADQALDGKDRILGVGHGLTLCRLPDEEISPILGERHDGWGGATAFGVLNDVPWPARLP